MEKYRQLQLELLRAKEAQRAKIIFGGVRYYKPMPHQQRFHEDTHRTRLLSGGNKSAKTYSGCVEDVLIALGKHPTRPHKKAPNLIWVGTDSHENTRDIFKPLFEKLIPRDALKKVVLGPRDQIKRYEFKNGSEIGFKSYESKRESFQGPVVDWIHLDEEPPEDIYVECLARGMTCQGEIIMTMTAVEGITWVYDRLYLEAIQDPNSGIGYHRFSTMDNIYIPEEEKERMYRSMNEEERRIRLYGEFVYRQGVVFKDFSRDIHVIPSASVPKGSSFYEAFDPGLVMFAGIFAHADHHGTMIVHDELYLKDADLGYVKSEIHRIREQHASRREDTVIDPQSKAKQQGMPESVITQMGDNPDAVHCMPANNDRTAGIFQMKEYMTYERDEKNNALTVPRLLIMDRCKNIIREMENYHYSKNKFKGTKDADRIEKKDDHGVDALRYMLIRRPSPSELNVRSVPTGMTLDRYERESKRLQRHHKRQELNGMKKWHNNL